MQKKWKCVLPVVLLVWIAFIFCRSFQPVDASRVESRWVLELLRRVVSFDLTEHMVRKAAHFTEFAVLGVLAGLLVGRLGQSFWLEIVLCLTIGLFVALCDETIQLFVEGRGSQVSDVWLDFSGAVTGAAVVSAIQWAVARMTKGKEND